MKTIRSNSKSKLIGLLTAVVLIISMPSCKDEVVTPTKITRDQVYHSTLQSVRLKDGVPLNIKVAVRWKIADFVKFSEQFESPNKYDTLILAPRQLELANDVSNKYINVDTLFNSQRHQFISDLKTYLMANLGEDGVEIKEVIVSDVIFPYNYTNGKEKLALQQQDLERIRKQAEINEENANASKRQAVSNGQVLMAQAEQNAKVQKIKAETEKSIRLSKLAQAETQKQVSVLTAESEAKRRVLLAKADLTSKKDLKNLRMQEQRDRDKIEIDKKVKLEQVAFDTDMRMAKLCSDNPVYATYMVNKELASKVQIAVLPNNQDGSVFNSLLNNKIASK